MIDLLHVIPRNDIKEHIQSVHCHCNPRIVGDIAIHNSYDGREMEERLKEDMKKTKN